MVEKMPLLVNSLLVERRQESQTLPPCQPTAATNLALPVVAEQRMDLPLAPPAGPRTQPRIPGRLDLQTITTFQLNRNTSTISTCSTDWTDCQLHTPVNCTASPAFIYNISKYHCLIHLWYQFQNLLQ